MSEEAFPRGVNGVTNSFKAWIITWKLGCNKSGNGNVVVLKWLWGLLKQRIFRKQGMFKYNGNKRFSRFEVLSNYIFVRQIKKIKHFQLFYLCLFAFITLNLICFNWISNKTILFELKLFDNRSTFLFCCCIWNF